MDLTSNSSGRCAPRPLLLDGGMGHQLKAMGVEISGEIGTLPRFLGVAMANTEQPDLVRDAHLTFIDAGCDVITTNNYAVTPKVVALAENTGHTMESLLKDACQAAVAAREARPNRHVKIAGCVPPLAETYRVDRVGTFEDNVDDYRLITTTIAKYCDVLLCETMSTILEGQAACTAALETGLPVWISFVLSEDAPMLKSGESLEAAVKAMGAMGAAGFLFNCSSPEVTTKALRLLHACADIIPPTMFVGGYANGFVSNTTTGEYRKLSGEEYCKFMEEWLECGSHVVGGCCGIFPQHIACMRARLDLMGQSRDFATATAMPDFIMP